MLTAVGGEARVEGGLFLWIGHGPDENAEVAHVFEGRELEGVASGLENILDVRFLVTVRAPTTDDIIPFYRAPANTAAEGRDRPVFGRR